MDFKDSPVCTMPNPSIIIAIARIAEKIELDKLLTAVRGLLFASALFHNPVVLIGT